MKWQSYYSRNSMRKHFMTKIFKNIIPFFSVVNTGKQKEQLYCIPVLLCTFFLCLVRCHLLTYSSLHSVHLYTIFIVPPELELSGTLGSSWEPLLIFFKCFLRLLLVENIHSQWLHLYSSFWLWTLCLWLERSVFVIKSFSQSTHT